MLKQFLHIIRWLNLLMVAGIQCVIYIRLLHPGASVLKSFDFILLSVVTVLIAASGFVINDFYDTRIDSINRPKRWIAGNVWPLLRVKQLYFALVLVGGILAFLLAAKLGLTLYFLIYPIAIVGLWYYSFALKCKPLVGNLWVALFCAGVVVIMALPDWLSGNEKVINPEVWFYTVFAFVATCYREIVKDIEDVEGDKTGNCKTFIVRYGIKAGKIVATIAGIILLIALFWWDSTQTNNMVKVILLMIQGAVVSAMGLFWWAKEPSYYHHASTLIKIIMLAGTVVLFIT